MTEKSSMNNKDLLDLRWNGKLPENYGQIFNEIAYLIRKEFIELIEQLSSNMSNNLDWWVEGPASRNYFSSPLFHYCCSLIFIENVPEFNDGLADQCRRFISLIDMLYEQNCSIVLLAASPITSLCKIDKLKKEFARTSSRLYEMTIIKQVK